MRGTFSPNLTSAGPTGPTGPFLSSYMEALGDRQSIARDGNVVFDLDSIDSIGNNIVLDPSGTVFTIYHTGLYHIEWSVNLELETGNDFAVLGILENGGPVSGASSSASGAFSSGTLINVDTVPFTISLHNYDSDISIEIPEQPIRWENTAASIRIVRFADGPSV